MAALHIAKVSMLVKVKVPMEQLQALLPAPVDQFGEMLAKQVVDYEAEHQLAYFPALEFLQQQNIIDQYLLDAAQQIAEASISFTKAEVLNSLIPVFSNVQLDSINSVAFTLPPMRPGNNQVLKALAEHYTPDTVKFELQVSIIQKQASTAGVEEGATRITQRWLSHKFDFIEITAARLLQ